MAKVRSLFGDQQGAQSFAQERSDFFSQPLQATNVSASPTPRVNGFLSAAAPVVGGLAAGQAAGAPTDPLAASIGIGVSTLSGAASGALAGAAGGPIGALG